MLAIIQNSMAMYKQVFGDGAYLTLFICALVYVFLDHNEKVRKVFLGHTLLFSMIYWCPISAYIIAVYCIGGGTYWRMFWMLPMTIVIAYVFTKLFDHAKNCMKKLLLFCVIMILLVDCGSRIYHVGYFQPATNPYKLNQAVVDAAYMIRLHAGSIGLEDVGVLPADPFVTELREFDAGIRMPYGRNMLRGLDNRKRALKIYQAMNATEINPKMLKKYAKKGNYSYLIYSELVDQTVFETVGYTLIGHSYGYNIYYIEID